MLSKQVKRRIARNKFMRNHPKWRQDIDWYIRLELGCLQQRRLSSKHLENAAERIAEIDATIKKVIGMKKWTRLQWRAFQADMARKMNEPGASLDGHTPELVDSNVLLNALPSCKCGKFIGGYNVGVVCDVCHTTVKRADPVQPGDLKSLYDSTIAARSAATELVGSLPLSDRFAVRRKILESFTTQEQIDRAYRGSAVNLQSLGRLKRPVVLPADPAQLAKDFEGDVLNRNLGLEQRNPSLKRKHVFSGEPLPFSFRPAHGEVLRVRSINTDITGDELVTQYAGWYERRYHETLTQEEVVAEVQRVGEKQANEQLRQELIRNRTRLNGDPWSELRVVLQPTADRYYERVLHRPRVRDSKGEREMTETEWNLWEQYQHLLESGAVEWQPGFVPTPLKKEGE
ncbi:hypothetical protein [Burkholderia phage FLC9]|nr:hypothetical protein [Burkholderia phage FLC9]